MIEDEDDYYRARDEPAGYQSYGRSLVAGRSRKATLQLPFSPRSDCHYNGLLKKKKYAKKCLQKNLITQKKPDRNCKSVKTCTFFICAYTAESFV